MTLPPSKGPHSESAANYSRLRGVSTNHSASQSRSRSVRAEHGWGLGMSVHHTTHALANLHTTPLTPLSTSSFGFCDMSIFLSESSGPPRALMPPAFISSIMPASPMQYTCMQSRKSVNRLDARRCLMCSEWQFGLQTKWVYCHRCGLLAWAMQHACMLSRPN